jgi:hypothetical protein
MKLICSTCGEALSPRQRCLRCYRRRCTRCHRPLLLSESVRFTATEAYHLVRAGCAKKPKGQGQTIRPRRQHPHRLLNTSA